MNPGPPVDNDITSIDISSVDLATIVVAHQQRHTQATRLARHLNAAIVLDDGQLGVYGNHARALRLGASIAATHVLTIEDDAAPIADFQRHATAAISHRPDQIIGLYVGRQDPNDYQPKLDRAIARADDTNATWLHHTKLLWGVATIYPADTIPRILHHPKVRASSLGYDQRVSLATPELGGVHYTWPSLVDHTDGPSVITGRARRTPGRVAHRVGIPDWSTTEVEIR